MEKRNRIISYLFVLGILLAIILPIGVVKAAPMGSLTIRKFVAEHYENLKEATGADSDKQNIPDDAIVLADITFRLEKLLVGIDDTTVTKSNPIDTSFTPRSQQTNSEGELLFSSLPEGFYLVTEELSNEYATFNDGKFIIQIPMTITDAKGNETTNYDVVLYPKNQKLQIVKVVASEKKVVGVDDIVTWKVDYPVGIDLKLEESLNGVITTTYGRNFYITDEMDERLDYIEGSAILRYLDAKGEAVPGFTLSEDIDYKMKYDKNAHILRIDFTDDVGTKKIADAKIATIELTLSTIVNAKAIDNTTPIWNNARISYDNHTGDPHELMVFPPGTDIPDWRVPKVYVGELEVLKVDENNREVVLAGARFALATTLEEANQRIFLERTIDEQGNQAPVYIETDSNGQARITAIGAGTYYLVEIDAPKDYILIATPIKVVVGNEDSQRIARVEVANKRQGKSPPKTFTPTPKITTTEIVRTGDYNNLIGWLLLGIASLGITFKLIKRHKKDKAYK